MNYRRIDFSKKFVKQFKKLGLRHQENFYLKLELWKINSHDKSLRDHALKGKFIGYRSIDIEPDLRALYYAKDDVIVIFALIGTHNQLYG